MVTHVCMDGQEVRAHGYANGYANFELSIPSEMAEIPLWGKNSGIQTVFQVGRKNFVLEMSPKSAHKNSEGAQRTKDQETLAWPLNNANASSYLTPHSSSVFQVSACWCLMEPWLKTRPGRCTW